MGSHSIDGERSLLAGLVVCAVPLERENGLGRLAGMSCSSLRLFLRLWDLFELDRPLASLPRLATARKLSSR